MQKYEVKVPFEVGFTKHYRIYSPCTEHCEQPSLLVCTVQIFFRSKIMKNNSDYSILGRFKISLKFALFYMLFVSFIFLLRGVESIISHLGIIFVWSTIFSMFFWTPLGRRLRHFMDKVPVFWTVVAINCVAFEHYVIKNKILRRSE